jgi:hypothetical protein
MRAYLTEAREKRLNLLKAVHATYRVRAIRAEHQATAGDLANLMKRVDAVLIADGLLGRVEQWWAEASTQQGLGRGAITFELQHRKGLRALYADLATGASFQRQLAEVQSLPPSAKTCVGGRIDLYVSLIRDEIQRLESKGWRGFLAEQKLMTARRRQHLSSYSAACAQSIVDFERIAARVVSPAGIADAEAAYLTQVRLCMGR